MLKHCCQAGVYGTAAGKDEAWLSCTSEACYRTMQQLLDLCTPHLTSDLHHRWALARCSEALRNVEGGVPNVVLGCSADLLHMLRDGAERSVDPTSPEKDWRRCLQLVAESQRFLIEGLQLAVELGNQDVAQELLQLEDDMYVLRCRSESSQARDGCSCRRLMAVAAGT